MPVPVHCTHVTVILGYSNLISTYGTDLMQVRIRARVQAQALALASSIEQASKRTRPSRLASNEHLCTVIIARTPEFQRGTPEF